MIKKFSKIKNLAVFKDFVWDHFVKDNDGNIVEYKKINILYGQNYSGKTTLSRIVRALETGCISDKYQSPEFEVIFDDGTSINQTTLKENTHEIRVFNEDFVRENLSFLTDTNHDGEIKPFAILGEDNAKLQEKINSIKALLGSNEEGKESELYKEKILKINAYNEAKRNYDNAFNSLEKKLSDKASGNRVIAIKYKPELFGDQNYNVNKLHNDIEKIKCNYTPIGDETKNKLQLLLKEDVKEIIPSITEIKINISEISQKVKHLVEQKVGNSHKIEELVRDIELNRWVKEGRKYHKEKNLNICSFCGNTISNDRWSLLDQHFDEESEKLDNDLEQVLNQLIDYERKINAGLGINKAAFYSKFQSVLVSIEDEYLNNLKNNALDAIGSLKRQIVNRKNNLFSPSVYEEINDFTTELYKLYKKYHQIEKESNDYSSQLSSEQSDAKNQLRLYDVYCFIQEINYFDESNKIDSLKSILSSKNQDVKKVEDDIKEKERTIHEILLLMNDEEKGAKLVDKYLNDYFGHNYLSLQAKEENDDTGKHFKFEILRNGNTAYNLSEGECSLIAFCYFMAKLEDAETHGKRPIIWIDDPISSLDNNHVFFIYSLIVSKIADTNCFSQLFVSTHNLNFLGYLKRMNGKYLKSEPNKAKQYFCVNRCFEESCISLMPNYLKEHITEFNYLFKELYECSKIKVVDNSNFQTFYNFGNNARKFLEIFLFYKYPDETEERVKMEKFFGKDKVPVIFSERINNEYSHLKENVSRGFSTIDVPEMKQVAELIINSIKRNDEDQYNALLRSVGITA